MLGQKLADDGEDRAEGAFRNMRIAIAAVIVAITLPGLAVASSSKSACKTRNSQMYKFCKTNARTKQAKSSCKATYKQNKRTCK